jgi:hypothetical protein
MRYLPGFSRYKIRVGVLLTASSTLVYSNYDP